MSESTLIEAWRSYLSAPVHGMHLADHPQALQFFAGKTEQGAPRFVIRSEAKPVKRRFGQVAYIYAAVRPVMEARGTRVKLRIDGKPHRHRVMFMVVTNIQYYAGTYLAPEAQADDGLFDVFLFDGDSWSWVMGLEERFRTGAWGQTNSIRARWHDPETTTFSQVVDGLIKLRSVGAARG